jgi:Mrp family chromosome partitioning ATPase
MLSQATQRGWEHGASEEQTVDATQSGSESQRPPLKPVSRDAAPGWASLVRPTEVSNLWLLPCGKQSEADGELFMSAAITEFLEEAGTGYDFVIIDTPPVMAADDATSLAPRIDGVLFVLRAGHTSARVARAALDLLYLRKTRVLGLLFNAVRPGNADYYYHYYEYHPGESRA